MVFNDFKGRGRRKKGGRPAQMVFGAANEFDVKHFNNFQLKMKNIFIGH